jgi:hypothetical protein
MGAQTDANPLILPRSRARFPIDAPAISIGYVVFCFRAHFLQIWADPSLSIDCRWLDREVARITPSRIFARRLFSSSMSSDSFILDERRDWLQERM